MKDNFERLDKIRQDYPELTFDNDGYEYLRPDVIEDHKEQIAEIEDILKEVIGGFDHFNNFKPRKDGSFAVRFHHDYNYDFRNDPKMKGNYPPFTGVEYFALESFKDEAND